MNSDPSLNICCGACKVNRLTLLSVVFLLAFGLLMLTPTSVCACSCAPSGSPEEELRQATAVFTGQVVQIDQRNRLVTSSFDPIQVTFQVTEVWKGPEQAVLNVSTPRGGASCGYPFESGKEYLVYAQGSETNLEVWLCSRTTPLTIAAGDLSILGVSTVPAPDSLRTVTAVSWLPAVFFMFLGLLLLMGGLFMSQINRRLGLGNRSELFTNPRFQHSARLIERISSFAQVSLGLGMFLQGIGSILNIHVILNVFSFFLLGLAGIGILVILGITVRYWRA